MRSSGRGFLVVPKSRLVTKDEQAFAVWAPQLWGSLPENLRQAQSVSSFKTLLKSKILILMLKLSYSSFIILTHCSLPFALLYGVFVSTLLLFYNVFCVSLLLIMFYSVL